MNEKTWKYHPRRSPRKRESLAAKLCRASIDFYADAVEELFVTHDGYLQAFMGCEAVLTPRVADSGVVAITPEMEETMRPRTFSAKALEYGSNPNAYYLPDDWGLVRGPLPKPKGTA